MLDMRAGSHKDNELAVFWERHERLLASCPQLSCAQIPRKFYIAAFQGFEENIQQLEIYFRLDYANYEKAMHELLWIEEAFRAIELRRFDLEDQRLTLVTRRPNSDWDLGYAGNDGLVRLIRLWVDGLADGQLGISLGDSMLLRRHGSQAYAEHRIDRIEGNHLMSRLEPAQIANYGDEAPHDVALVSNGIPFKRCHEALNLLARNPNLKNGLLSGLPTPNKRQARIDFKASETAESERDLEGCNEHQREAIRQMVEQRCRPKPFVLFGPPGTGKTLTLVKAVGQIMARSSWATVLVSANSNVCADSLAERLLKNKLVPPNQLVRFISKAQLDPVPSSQHKSYEQYEWPKENAPRICVTTNISAGRIRAQFDFVFIDEAGHANEPEALIPMSKLRGDGCVVLAGDPKQLGPVLRLSELGRYGLGESILTRLLKMKIYKKNQDGLYQTDLLETYRCDERIMTFWSKHIYPNKGLISRGRETPAELLQALAGRLGPEFRYPMVFRHQVGGVEDELGSNGISRRNPREAEQVCDLLEKLRLFFEPNQIGVISPYKLQAKTITHVLTERAVARRRDHARNQRAARKSKSKPNRTSDSGIDSPGEAPVASKSTPAEILRERKWIEFERNLVERRQHFDSTQSPIEHGPKKPSASLEINTVDAFQGNEKDVIIIATVRTPTNKSRFSLPFIDDLRRFNVAMSRAKQLLIVFGHQEALKVCNHWPSYMKYIHKNTRRLQ